MDYLKKANEDFMKIINWVEENRKYFEFMNLKLENLFYYCYKNGIDDSYFYDFCEIIYDFFVEDLKENYNINFDDIKYQLGRTSSFYLHDQSFISFDSGKKRTDLDIPLLFEKLSFEGGFCDDISSEFLVDENNKIYLEESLSDTKEEIEDAKELLADNLLEEFEYWKNKYFEDIKNCYDLIESYKKNQIVFFKEYYNDQKNLGE